MFVTNHVLAGALLGALVGRADAAAGVGVASHFALDAVPHYGAWPDHATFWRAAIWDGLAGLATMAVVTAAAPPGRRAAVLAGAVGGALPDLNKPGREFFGRSPLPRPVDAFHARIQREHRNLRREVTAGFVLAASAGVALARLRLRWDPWTYLDDTGARATVEPSPAAR